MAPNIYCCGAGTAADTEAVTGIFELCSMRKPIMQLFMMLLLLTHIQLCLFNCYSYLILFLHDGALYRHGQFTTAAASLSHWWSRITGCYSSYTFEISPFQVSSFSVNAVPCNVTLLVTVSQ